MLSLLLTDRSGKLPTSQYDLMKDAHKIGMLQIRHRASHNDAVPPHMASHIYYEIDPAYRGQGYGKKILELGLREAKNIGLEEVFITCCEDNLASKAIIEANGGIFLEEAFVPAMEKKLLKFRKALV